MQNENMTTEKESLRNTLMNLGKKELVARYMDVLDYINNELSPYVYQLEERIKFYEKN